jgi:hypothetical protein
VPLMIAFVEVMVGAAGVVFTKIVCDAAAEVPHALVAVTVTFPPVAFAVVVIELVVDVPVQPLGNVQV